MREFLYLNNWLFLTDIYISSKKCKLSSICFWKFSKDIWSSIKCSKLRFSERFKSPLKYLKRFPNFPEETSLKLMEFTSKSLTSLRFSGYFGYLFPMIFGLSEFSKISRRFLNQLWCFHYLVDLGTLLMFSPSICRTQMFSEVPASA